MISIETLCKLLYASFETEYGTGKVLARCIPYDGVNLYEIEATYARQRPSASYYYLGRSEKDARQRFKSLMGDWMRITSVRQIPPGDEAEKILTDKLRMPKT